MEKLEKINTKNEILELQKQEKLTITITKKQATLIGFALNTEREGIEKLVKDLCEDLEKKDLTQEQKTMIKEIISNSYEDFKELTNMFENLKKYYGIIEE